MSLKGFSNIGDSTVTNDIRDNLKLYLDYGLLEKSNFINVSIPQTGIYGGLEHILRPVKDPRYTNGQVWQAFRGNLVWESGFGAFTSTDNARPGVSGVYVNNTFYPTSTTGTYEHYIDHKNGQVVFTNAISTTASVQLNYSYKYINVIRTNGAGFFQQLQSYSENSEKTNFINQSGEWAQFAENRAQPPIIGIETLPSQGARGYQLGGGQVIKTDFACHCIAEDNYFRDFLKDVMVCQNDTTIQMFNLNAIATANKFPIDYRGVPTSGALRYNELVANYPYGWLTFYMRLDSLYEVGNLYVATIKCTTEVILDGV